MGEGRGDRVASAVTRRARARHGSARGAEASAGVRTVRAAWRGRGSMAPSRREVAATAPIARSSHCADRRTTVRGSVPRSIAARARIPAAVTDAGDSPRGSKLPAVGESGSRSRRERRARAAGSARARSASAGSGRLDPGSGQRGEWGWACAVLIRVSPSSRSGGERCAPLHLPYRPAGGGAGVGPAREAGRGGSLDQGPAGVRGRGRKDSIRSSSAHKSRSRPRILPSASRRKVLGQRRMFQRRAHAPGG